MLKFNVTLLAKQGCRLIHYPDSLLVHILKAKYYPRFNFLSANLGSLPLYTWKSVWAVKGLLEKGLCWRVGSGVNISVMDDVWLFGVENYKINA